MYAWILSQSVRGSCSSVVIRWTADQNCIHSKVHLISPGCPRPSVALQYRIGPKTIHATYMVQISSLDMLMLLCSFMNIEIKIIMIKVLYILEKVLWDYWLILKQIYCVLYLLLEILAQICLLLTQFCTLIYRFYWHKVFTQFSQKLLCKTKMFVEKKSNTSVVFQYNRFERNQLV